MEISILDWIQSMRTPIGDVVVPLITKLGDEGMIWILLSVVLLRRREEIMDTCIGACRKKL